jgi:hypothetical protein
MYNTPVMNGFGHGGYEQLSFGENNDEKILL